MNCRRRLLGSGLLEPLKAPRSGQTLRALANLPTRPDVNLFLLLDGFDAGVDEVIR